ncbi:MAG: nodulation protein NfeD [Chloroflexi bacterium]|nr:nodulation protein NfeD [Chloroflexota bacterium]MBM3172847.1 nodulation protein NfeD [Chloroflexota bacterium]MBM3174103.1 nodulation protein NfeD [Chloroflexota bacterium]MBM4449825.1 nodulation protein NfeD [Chloroflexota bacterium]
MLCSLTTLFVSSGVEAEAPSILVLSVDGNIVPIVADYIERGIRYAESNGNVACVIELSTPGGLLNSTEKIVQVILNAEVPVVVYVSPKGSWAASAGTFITVAAHVAAMAPGTSIGAAHPVAMGQEMPEAVSKKVTEHSAAWIRSIAEMRGRDAEQARLAVTESKSFTDSEALEARLIDFQADDLDALVVKLNGRKVTLGSGKEVVIDTSDYVLSRKVMNHMQRFLHVISDPNIAYILLSLATIGLITEISNPGMVFPGVAGGVSLLLAFYSLGVLNAYWAGILLMLLAFGLFIAEIFTASFGILIAGGIVSFIMGSLILFSRTSPEMEVNRWLIAIVATVMAAFVLFMVWAIIRGQRRKVATGTEGLLGKTAVVKTRLAPKGSVLVDGEHWAATVESGSVEPEEEVIITKVEGLRLIVTKKKTKGRKS